MASSVPPTPANLCDIDGHLKTSSSRPSPSKFPRLDLFDVYHANSFPPRHTSSPIRKPPQIRPRLNQYHTFDHAVSLFKCSKNIIILTGAGISTSLGVPDFRSKNGVYDILADCPYDDPQELFHIDNFKSDPSLFYQQAARVFPRMQGLVPADGGSGVSAASNIPLVPKFSSTHAFISMLQSKGKLLTNYTQNIDGLETAAGVSSSKLIQCHGTLSTASCMTCGKRTTARKYMPVVRQGGIPFCKCSQQREPKEHKRRGRTGQKKRKRLEFEDSSESESDSFPRGLMKPDMTFFGEGISNSYAPRVAVDKQQVDLLVIIGTSLQVEPVNTLLFEIPPSVPQIWISKDRCQREGVKVDIELLGECDLVLEEIARRAGWSPSLNTHMWSPEKQHKDTLKGAGGNGAAKPVGEDLKKEQPHGPPARALQMRPKMHDQVPAGGAVKPSSEIALKVNDKLINAPEKTGKADTLDVKKESKSALKPMIKSNGNGSTRDHDKKPKVTVELEEGTRSRWYVRRAR